MSNKKSNKNSNLNVKNNVENKEKEIRKAFTNLNNLNKIKSTNKNSAKTIDEIGKKWDMNDKIVELFKDEIECDNSLKSKYAVILIKILIVQLFILNILFLLNGLGILKYSDTTFNIFISGGIAEVFVLVRVIVKYLFSDNLSDALKIIIENNNKVENKSDIVKNK